MNAAIGKRGRLVRLADEQRGRRLVGTCGVNPSDGAARHATQRALSEGQSKINAETWPIVHCAQNWMIGVRPSGLSARSGRAPIRRYVRYVYPSRPPCAYQPSGDRQSP